MTGKEKALALQHRARSLIAAGKDKIEDVTFAGAAVAGGAFGGYLDGAHAEKNVFGLDLGLAVGAGLALVGVAGIGGKVAPMALHFGAGVLAYETGKRVAEKSAESASVGGVRGLASGRRVAQALGQGSDSLADARAALGALHRRNQSAAAAA